MNSALPSQAQLSRPRCCTHSCRLWRWSCLCSLAGTQIRGLTRECSSAPHASVACTLSSAESWSCRRFFVRCHCHCRVRHSSLSGRALPACSRSLILHAHIITEPTAVMVLDHKGRVLHATAKLASLLGHPMAKLTKMELNNLLPQPICQMHGAWFKVSVVVPCVFEDPVVSGVCLLSLTSAC